MFAIEKMLLSTANGQRHKHPAKTLLLKERDIALLHLLNRLPRAMSISPEWLSWRTLLLAVVAHNAGHAQLAAYRRHSLIDCYLIDTSPIADSPIQNNSQ